MKVRKTELRYWKSEIRTWYGGKWLAAFRVGRVGVMVTSWKPIFSLYWLEGKKMSAWMAEMHEINARNWAERKG